MKKKEKYEVVLTISKDGKVTDGACACPGGVRPGCCKHVFGVLSALEDYSRLELFKAPTEKLQQWHQPKPAQVQAMKVSDLFGESDHPTYLESSAVNINVLNSIPQNVPIFSVLNGSAPGAIFRDELFYTETMPLPCPLQANNFFSGIAETPDYLELDSVLFYHEHIKADISVLKRYEKETLFQDNQLWHFLRRNRLTASTIHQILSRKGDFEKLASDFVKQQRDISNIPAVQFGRRMEAAVKNQLVANYPQHIFRSTGCVVSPSHPFIAASPDGLLFKNEDSMIIQIKCIFNPTHLSLEDLVKCRKDFCLEFSGRDTEESLRLKRNHRYYHQILCQLFCAGIDKCLFVVHHSSTKPMYFETVAFDREYWKLCLLKLRDFYFKYYIKELMSLNVFNLPES